MNTFAIVAYFVGVGVGLLIAWICGQAVESDHTTHSPKPRQ